MSTFRPSLFLGIRLVFTREAIPSSYFRSHLSVCARFTVMNVSNQTRGPKNGNETDFYYALR